MAKYVDCRAKGCSLRISGNEDEVVDTAFDHAVKAHGERSTSELRDQIRSGLRDEDEGARSTIGGSAGMSTPGGIH